MVIGGGEVRCPHEGQSMEEVMSTCIDRNRCVARQCRRIDKSKIPRHRAAMQTFRCSCPCLATASSKFDSPLC